MALTKCAVADNIIGSLGTTTTERGLTTQQFKDKFDEGTEGIKAYLNDTLTAEVDTQLGLKAAKTQAAWVAPAMINAWVSEDAGYMKDGFGFVHLRGIVKNGSLTNAAFILPEGYRPFKIARISVATHDGVNPAIGQIQISPVGTVTPSFGSTANFYLDGVVFQATQ